jgi:hypothetical protein
MKPASLLALVLLLSGCSQTQSPPPGTITHVVICYLKQPADPAARRKLIDASKEFRAIPGVLDVRVGKALPSTRPIVVSDYDVGVVITYRDADAMKIYATHPIHEKAVREVLQPLTSKVIIYDFVNE